MTELTARHELPTRPDLTDWTDDSSWTGTRAALTQCTGLDPAAYVDERFFALEQELVFGRAWVTVGLAAEVAAPGPMLVRQVGQTSIVITRGCLLYTSPSPRDLSTSRMPSSA